MKVVRATLDMVEAELRGAPGEVADALDVELPADWPPEHHDEGFLRWTLGFLRTPGNDDWALHYIAADGVLAGTCGFHGPPQDGSVEVGYSVVPSMQRRGLASTAVAQLIALAQERGVRIVTARTQPELAPSIGVLRKLGFTETESDEPGVVAYQLELDA